MPAAQPADPARPHLPADVNGSDDASVIPLNHRGARRGGPLQAVRGRWHMTTQQPDQPHPGPEAVRPPAAAGASPPTDGAQRDTSALRAWAETIETSFVEIGQSLTDPRTRDAFLVTLALWERILHGSHAGGIIDAAALDELLVPLRGMRHAPGIIDGT